MPRIPKPIRIAASKIEASTVRAISQRHLHLSTNRIGYDPFDNGEQRQTKLSQTHYQNRQISQMINIGYILLF